MPYRDGRWDPRIVEATGVYAVRDRRSKSVLYVGESHSRRLKYTLTRKFQRWEGEPKRGARRHRGSVTLGDPRDVEVKIWYLEGASDSEVWDLENELRYELEPEYNPLEPIAEDEPEDVPF